MNLLVVGCSHHNAPIAVRAGVPLADAERILAELERKRLIYNFAPPGKPPAYMAQQFVIGFWEGQVDRLDRELVELFEEYLPVYAQSGAWEKTPQLRTIPVHESQGLAVRQASTLSARWEREECHDRTTARMRACSGAHRRRFERAGRSIRRRQPCRPPGRRRQPDRKQ